MLQLAVEFSWYNCFETYSELTIVTFVSNFGHWSYTSFREWTISIPYYLGSNKKKEEQNNANIQKIYLPQRTDLD